MELKTEIEKKGGLCVSPFILQPEIENILQLGDSRMLYLWRGRLTAVPVIGSEVWGYLAQTSQSDEELQAFATGSGLRVLKKTFGIETEPSLVIHPDTPFQKYTGRQYTINVQDCYQLIREFYFREKGVELRDHDAVAFWEDGGALKGRSMIEELEKDGFRVVSDDLHEGDLLAMSYDAPKGFANHLAVWHDGQVLHHQPDRLSQSQEYSTFLKSRTVARLRYGKEASH